MNYLKDKYQDKNIGVKEVNIIAERKEFLLFKYKKQCYNKRHMKKMQEIYINLDDSGKLSNHEHISVYGGLVFLSKCEKDKFVTQYRSIVNDIKFIPFTPIISSFIFSFITFSPFICKKIAIKPSFLGLTTILFFCLFY